MNITKLVCRRTTWFWVSNVIAFGLILSICGHLAILLPGSKWFSSFLNHNPSLNLVFVNRITTPIRNSTSVVEQYPEDVATLNNAEIIKFGNELPPYPMEAVRRGWGGTVTLKLKLDESGRVSDSEIIKSSGIPILDIAAREASIHWKFPGMVSHHYLFAPVKFSIES